MSTKRTLPKDFDIPLQSKQPRLEVLPPVTASPTFVFPSRTLSLPLQGISAIRPPTHSPAALIGIPGILPTTSPLQPPSTPQFDFPAQISPSISLPAGLAGITPSPQTASSLNTFVATAAAIRGLQLPQSPVTLPTGITALSPQFAPSPTAAISVSVIRPGAASTPIPSSLIAASPMSTPTLLHATPPPPYYPTPTPIASTAEQSSDEFTCSSPSQFLHSPTSLRLPITSLAAISTDSPLGSLHKDNRQPVCSLPSRNVSHLGKNGSLKSKVLKYKKAKLAGTKLKYEVQLKEKFFLEGGGNMMEFVAWKRRANPPRDRYLRLHGLDSESSTYHDLLSPKEKGQASKMDVSKDRSVSSDAQRTPQKHHKESKSPRTSSKASHLRSHSSTASPTRIQIPLSTVTPSLQVSGSLTTPKTTPTSPARVLQLTTTPSPRPGLKSQASFSSVYESSHEDIVMRARHEAEVMRAISDLRKEGLWSASRLPKVREPARRKTQWDYLLEEMQWLATDFANERRWKRNAAKKLCRSVARQYQEKDLHHVRTEKEELLRLRKIASTIAKEVKHFWDSIQKIVEHKHHVLLEEKRKKAMDMHLEFIVDQTAKYSNWLVKGLASKTPSEPSLQSVASHDDSDAFLTPVEESDDEETINIEEKQIEKEGTPDYMAEIKQLQEEGEIPLDQLLASLPPEMLEGNPLPSEDETTGEMEMETEKSEKPPSAPLEEAGPSGQAPVLGRVGLEDVDYQMSESEGEDETTIAEQEEHEEDVDASTEVDALQKEGELPLEELLKLYNMEQRRSATPETDIEGETSVEGEASVKEEDMETGEDGGSSSSGEESAEEDGQGIELLVSGKSLEEACQTEEGLSNVAAAAEQFQPKGITLATTEVRTKVPFLLKHVLREYQHIGLEWLVAMDERRLNGILADEMGLGKTIQTIALLGHLACEKANWGPHLIIVPTSVMLNWECEFKKWCPAFKILTYFGSLKERKQKRVGWTKRNAFHVCITSYNIAVQDHRAFKQKRWKYLVLDEAQNIKNFKSQRWQTLLNFNSQRRLLLTGTPLQNNLMELWSLMHFLMPMVFSSHTDFKEWFSNPLTGMVEGSQEYNESIVKRLHQVLRPFLLRRLKMEVEKQMPKKYEHVMICRLSKRQRFLYDEYMSRTKTKDTLAGGNFLSVINILMQLRKVCNHPDLFEPRPILSSFRMAALECYTASLALKALEYEPFKHVNLDYLNLHLADYELDTEAFVTFCLRQLQALRAFITDPPIGPSLLTLGRETPSFLEDLHLPQLSSQRQEWTLSCRRHMHEVNTRRCRRQPMYGTDLIRLVRSVCSSNPALSKRSESLLHPRHWQWSGHAACTHHQMGQLPWGSNCNPLRAALHSCEERVEALRDMIDRFIIVVPQTTAPGIFLHVHHPSPSWALQQRQRSEKLARELSPRADFLHPVVTHTSFQFPETRLIQYDCGKLQTLDSLLRRLKAGTHRALIFTQMARMLDVLEIFLNYHGHTYLRLDGATPVQKRQVLMDRFNRDERVFCFILSTRSGGLGVNLTGADTVIFYDSDWNPTMDAQAQDRCHRIGQTRDVHIYRLVCDRTVEENILKKANQKRLLGDIAIEGGAFTTDFFKQVTLHDLFHQQERVVVSSHSSQIKGDGTSADKKDAAISERQIEEMLLQAEDDSDVQAAQMAKAEQAAEMAEFDENFSTQDPPLSREDQPPESEGSKALTEFAKIEEQLSGVERYAMKFLEAENAEFAAAQLRIAEENIELAKKDWELSHLQSLRKEEERLAEEEADDIQLTYDRPETSNKMYVDEATGEEMPIWFPPTPPADDVEDIYVDIVLNMSYDTSSAMSSTLLASIAMYSEDDYDVFGLLKQNVETEPLKRTHKTVMKQTKENVNVPPSLFWRRGAADSLSTKLRRLGTHQKKMKSKDQFTPILEQQPEGPTWTHFEDWALLKSVTNVLEYPLSLTISVPAQNPNWNIVADLTSTLSRVRRSPLQCREHVMSVVIPREDNTVKVDELEPKKYKSRDSTIKKTKSRRDQRTKNLILHDNGKELTKQYSHTFDWVTLASSKRKQAPKFTWEAVQKPSTHSNLLKDYGIDMDSVHSPTQIAVHRAERIQSELPRHSQMHQLLAAGQAQPYAHLSQITARAYPSGAAGFMKPAITGYLPPRQPLVSVATTTQRFQPLSNSAVTFSPSKIVTTGVPTSLTIPTTTPTTLTSHPTSLPAVTKMSSTMTEIGKLAPFTGGRLTQQQLYLLRQTALQHHQQQQQQQQHPPQPPPQLPQTVQPPQTTQLLAAQKLALPGIEQLRPAAVALSQRFPSVTSATMRSITAATGRNLRTEEVLALLKQQSLHMAASQAYKAGPATTFQTATPIQFRPEGGLQLAKPSTPSALPAQTEGVKVAPSPVSVESGQLKVEMVEQLQKPQQDQKPQQAPSEESSGTS